MLALLSLAFCSSGPEPGQPRGVVPVFEPPGAALAGTRFEREQSRGLFVGISDFSFSIESGRQTPEKRAESALHSIPYAVDDAVDLAHLFSVELKLIPSERVTLSLTGDPVKAVSLSRLTELQGNGAQVIRNSGRNRLLDLLAQASTECGEEGLLVVSFATHGVSLKGRDVLLAADSSMRLVEQTGIAVDLLLYSVAQSKSRRRIVLLDACREWLRSATARRAGADPESAMGAAFAAAIANSSGQVVLAGARQGGYAYDDPVRQNGVFTATLLEGLREAAPADARGFVTASTLGPYINEQVCEWVGRQSRPLAEKEKCGISSNIDGDAAKMPLALRPGRFVSRQDYQRRIGGALKLLRENVGDSITAARYFDVAKALPEYYPEEEGGRKAIDDLLEQIEALDGSARSQKAFAAYLDKWLPVGGGVVPMESADLPGPDNSAPDGPSFFEPKLVRVEAGEFLMGTSPERAEQLRKLDSGILESWFSNEMPQRSVHVAEFQIGVFEVTNREYERFLRQKQGGAPSRLHDPETPAANVSWHDAVAYCRWLSRLSGKDYSLPTEAQWEKAARGTDGREYPWGNDPPDTHLAVFKAGSAKAVGQSHKGPYGTYDMAGNVAEWCLDPYSPKYQEGIGSAMPTADAYKRVVRGGSWKSVAFDLRSAARLPYLPDARRPDVGFRIVLNSAPTGER